MILVKVAYDAYNQQFRLLDQTNARIFDDVERDVDRRAVKIRFGIAVNVGRTLTPEQAQEKRLKNIFRVFGVSCNAVGGAIDQIVVVLEHPLEILG